MISKELILELLENFQKAIKRDREFLFLHVFNTDRK